MYRHGNKHVYVEQLQHLQAPHKLKLTEDKSFF